MSKTTEQIVSRSVFRYLRRHIPRKDWLRIGGHLRDLNTRAKRSESQVWHHVAVNALNWAGIMRRRGHLSDAKQYLREAHLATNLSKRSP